jgi:ATP-binding protein involved in chromosome partitioning
VIVVTTPQEAAAEVAERAGTMAQMVHQRVAGVIENMSFLPCPHCGPEHRIEIFGTGGGQRVSDTLSARLGYPIPLLGEIPLDERLRSGGDHGTPLAIADADTPASKVIIDIADRLGGRPRGLLGRQLGLSPVGR